VIWLDTETFSPTPIKWGTRRYAEDAEVMIVTYALDDEPEQLWDVTTTSKMPGDLEYALYDTDEPVTAHNAYFDRTILTVSKNLRVPIALERWRCTMARALAHSLPGGLDKLGAILKIDQDQQKLKTGKTLMRLFCQPRPKNSKITRATRHTHPAEWAQFCGYATKDITAMRAVAAKLPDWNYRGEELDLWHLDQRVNDRGFLVDTDLAEAAIRAVNREQKVLADRTASITDDAVASTTQRDQLLAHILEAYGVDLPDLQASTLERRLTDQDLPDEVRELIAIRLQASSTSTRKYHAMIRAVSADGRARGTLQFCGANRTGRWAGRTIQPHNFPRPSMKQPVIDAGIEAFKADCADLITDNVMALASNVIRGTIVAPPGCKLVVADLANIEGRFAAWLCGELWKLQAFRDYDAGTGHDLYKVAYARAFGVSPDFDEKTIDGYLRRQIGKVMELMLQYEGGVGAFITGAATYHIDLDKMAAAALPTIPDDVLAEAEGFYNWCLEQKRPTFGLTPDVFMACDSLKRLWRMAHANIKGMWRDLKDTAGAAIREPGNTFTLGYLKFRCDGAWLRVRLPSGRYLCYPSPRVGDDGTVSYMGINPYTHTWSRIKTYGGKLLENITQAGSRDVLAHGMAGAEAGAYEPVLTVHDEIVAETPDTPEFTAAGLTAIMARVPAWAPGLPLAAAGFETYRYRKD
jgi:DNA polymerase